MLLLLLLFLIKPDSVEVFCFLASKTYFLVVYFNNPGTHPVEDPPAEHLVESSEQNEEPAAEDSREPHSETDGHGQEAANSETNEEGTNGKQKGKPEKRKQGNSVQRGPRKKKRLCDVVEQSNLHMQSLNESLASSSVSKETRAREREEDREFFRSIMGMMSQTMMGMTQLLVQGAGPGLGHSPGLQPMYPPPMSFGGYVPPVHRPSTPSSFTKDQSTSGDEVSDLFSL